MVLEIFSLAALSPARAESSAGSAEEGAMKARTQVLAFLVKHVEERAASSDNSGRTIVTERGSQRHWI